MSQPSTVGDLVRIALAELQPRAPRVEPSTDGSFARIAVLRVIALHCAARLCAAALGLSGSTPRRAARSRIAREVVDCRAWNGRVTGGRVELWPAACRTHADRRFSRGRLLRRRKLGGRRGSLAEARDAGMSSFRGCSWRLAVRMMVSDTSILQLLERGGYSMKALRALVVEDDAILGELLAKTLEGLGHAVCAVETNVAKAVAAASHWRPDLMIVDVGLGEASGLVAVKEILRSRIRPTCVRHRQCGERHAVGSRYHPHSKALPRAGPGASDSEGARNGGRFRPSRGEA